MKGRDYQIAAVEAIWEYFKTKQGNPIVALPTGTGKSVVIALFLRSIFETFYNQKVMVLTHVKELIEQNHSKLKSVWPGAPSGINSAGLGQRSHAMPMIFAGIGSVKNNPHLFGHVDLVIIDEAHLVSPTETTTYRKFLDDLKKVNPNLKIIGLTATPWRLGQGHLTEGGIFTDVCFDMTTMDAFNWFITEGYLSTLIPKKTQLLLDVTGVHKTGGEFKAGELQVAVDKAEITLAALRETIELAQDRSKWLIFASGVQHAKHVGEMLTYLGVSNVVIHSDMGDSERDSAIADFKSGKYQVAVNNNILTTGFDCPEIDLIVVLRPTASTVLWVQMLGRGTRPVYAPGFDLNSAEGRLSAIQAGPKQDCLVLDFAGNTKRLGPINDPLIPRAKGKGPAGEAPVKECPNCNTYNHTKAVHCVYCGYKFDFTIKIKQTASSDELIKAAEEIVLQVFRVDHISYLPHIKQGSHDSMKVTYYCGLRMFAEYVCFEHDGWAGRKARSWWKARTPAPFPESTEQGLEWSDSLSHAKFLKVHTNKKFPEIVDVSFEEEGFAVPA